MFGFSLNLPSGSLRAALSGAPPVPVPTPTPPPTSVTTLVIEGDSITFAGGSGNQGFAWQYAAAPPSGKTVVVNAENSRTVGGAAYNGQNADNGTPTGNTMALHANEDIATGAQAVVAMIGTNDLGSAFSVPTYKSRLADLGAVYRAAGVKFAWSPPIPMGTNQGYAGYAAFTAKRDALMATARDPAVWGLFADYYIPLGEQPDFAASDNTALIGADGVHPTQAGQDAMLPVFRAAVDTLFDGARAVSTQIYDAVWPVSETNLAPSTQITRRFVLRGLAHRGIALTGGNALAVTGGQVRVNGGAWVTSYAGWLYSGDTVDLRLTTSASNSTDTNIPFQIGAETRTLTYRTVASVTPAAYVHGDVQTSVQTGPVHLYAARNFAASGVAVIGVNWRNGPVGVKVGGVAATRQVHQAGGYGETILDIWTVPVTAGSRDIELTATGLAGQDSISALSWGVVAGADPTPTAVVMANDADTANLATPTLTVAASGIGIGLLLEYAGGTTVAPAMVTASNGGTSAVDEGQGTMLGEVRGLAIAKRTTLGVMSWDFAGGGYGPHPRAALAFKAAGT